MPQFLAESLLAERLGCLGKVGVHCTSLLSCRPAEQIGRHIHRHICTHIHKHTHINIYLHICTCIYTSLHMYMLRIKVDMCIHIPTYIPTCIATYALARAPSRTELHRKPFPPGLRLWWWPRHSSRTPSFGLSRARRHRALIPTLQASSRWSC